MKKTILTFILIIIITVSQKAQSGDPCRDLCMTRAWLQHVDNKQNRFIATQQCNNSAAAANAAISNRSWVDALECMINGGCEDEKDVESFLDWCEDLANTRFEDCENDMMRQEAECEANCT
jgi:hypothetical protein